MLHYFIMIIVTDVKKGILWISFTHKCHTSDTCYFETLQVTMALQLGHNSNLWRAHITLFMNNLFPLFWLWFESHKIWLHVYLRNLRPQPDQLFKIWLQYCIPKDNWAIHTYQICRKLPKFDSTKFQKCGYLPLTLWRWCYLILETKNGHP